MWTPRVRTSALALTAPLLFTKLTLVERYGEPDTLLVEGDIEDLRPAFATTSGVVVFDADGQQRFSGIRPRHPGRFVTRTGDGTAQLSYEADLSRLWRRFCWPTPAAAWSAQTAAYDVQTAVHEARILGYIGRNAGSSAYNGTAGGVTVDRRIANLRLPTSTGRGVSGKTSARFQNLGQLVADLAEAANLRVTIVQTYDGTTPYLDVVIADVPDLSGWARFGDGGSGDLGLLDDSWSYGIGGGPSVFLSAAGGDLENRYLTAQVDSSIRTAWGYEEAFIDQRQDGTDTDQIAQGIATARAENAPTVEAQAPLAAGDLQFGSQSGQIPVGAKVTVSLDGEEVVDRIRQVTTTVQVADDEATETVEPLFGTPDAGLRIEQKALRRALKRLRNLEGK